ncbi:class I SAM-dependent methyltransferase [Lederbergia galactosidilytica]|uniref:Ubiquinone biosynthesis methyltransferase UbiE n=1 Tax=Lederbergia galactosidilytica TaxID=217031 RepID=A0A0Q9Y6T5_9BACI|nr:class I SAM-dependent methyltransferase [Lederbergia galactosidilytica]KRG11905.1 ubiquinone biosynthesis methyltransferase UbiE [Lederbergia galactosidilytica]KRG12340.1 ubiquinone biosynthesis methyltransferase UbiE [Virgibacillus soli]MBP1913864.1 ubiquinone/menaquinone biosynthesis C-methylase UbiE [Lederbergia galactosidilytica]OAK73914.1 ubiquinone biosynthesis methyltransferase UbiE [Lederbergia galactosidilytica]
MREKIKSAFNQLSEAYEHTVDKESLYNTELERPAMMLEIPKNLEQMQMLDAGCAAGWYTNEFLRRGAKVIAVDVSPEMVKATKRRVGTAAEVRCLDFGESLPFADETFDYIVSSLALHYIEDWRKTFSEFQRILKPNGILLFSVHHPTMDIHLSEKQAYFETELIIDQWKKNGQTVEVPFYRRSLATIVNEANTYFTIDKMIEPQPTGHFKLKKPEKYKKLMKSPHFLIVKVKNKK